MYAVICSTPFWNGIQQALLETGEILYKSINEQVDIAFELNTVARIAVKSLIIDISAIDDPKKLLHALIQYKIRSEKTQIIIVAPDAAPGDTLIHQLVTQIHTYDVIVPTKDGDLQEQIKESIANPGTFKKVVKWQMDATAGDEKKESAAANIRETERVIVRKQLVGKVVIGIAGTHHRVGCTHLALALVSFLRRKGYSVAYLQLHRSNDTEMFLKTYDDLESRDGYYDLKGIHYYLYDGDFNINVPYRRNYDFFVLDTGVYNPDNPLTDEYERANVKGIVTTAREWEIAFLEKFLKAADDGQYDYLVSYADEKLFQYLVNNMNAGESRFNIFRMIMESDLIDGIGLDEVFGAWLKSFVSTQIKQSNEKQSILKRIFR